MYWGEAAALATSICWSATAVFLSYSGRILGTAVVNLARLFFALIFLGLAHWILLGNLFPLDTEPFRWGWFAISSLLGLVLGDSFLFRAYVLVGPRIAMLMMSTVPIFSTLFGWILFNERVTATELLGILLAVSAVGWVVTERQPGRTVVQNRQYKIGILFGVLGALGQVTNLVTARFGLEGGYPTLSATIIRVSIALVILGLASAIRRDLSSALVIWRQRKAFGAVIAGSFIGQFLGIWLSLIAIQQARLGIASTLMALPPILLIPVDYLVYGRPISARGVTGTFMAIAGVALLFISG